MFQICVENGDFWIEFQLENDMAGYWSAMWCGVNYWIGVHTLAFVWNYG